MSSRADDKLPGLAQSAALRWAESQFPKTAELQLNLVFLPPKPLEPTRQLRPSFTRVGELGDEQRERLGVSRDPKRASVDRVETHVADLPSRETFGALVVAAVHQARSAGLALGSATGWD